jgi:hypothetical protein
MTGMLFIGWVALANTETPMCPSLSRAHRSMRPIAAGNSSLNSFEIHVVYV